MTINQLFQAIDQTNDRYLSEILESEPCGAAVRRKRPIKILAVCAACLAVMIAGTAIIPKLSGGELINPFSSLANGKIAGTIRKVQIDQITFSIIDCHVSFGMFSTSDTMAQGQLNVTKRTEVSTKLNVRANAFCDFDIPEDYPLNENVPVRIQLLSNGEPIEFKYNGKQGMYHDVVVDNVHDRINEFPVSFNADKSLKQVTAVVTVFPDTIEPSNLSSSSYRYLTAYSTIRNISSDSGFELDENDFSDTIHASAFIGYDHETEDSCREDFMYAKPGNSVSLMYGNPSNSVSLRYWHSSNVPYNLYLMIDGMLVDCFDGKCALYVSPDSQGTQRAAIPQSYIPQDGKHLLSVIQIPVLPTNKTSESASRAFSARLLTYDGRIPVHTYYGSGNLSVSAEMTEFKQGEPIKITATVKNRSSKELILACPAPGLGLAMNFVKDGKQLICKEGYFDNLNKDTSTTITLPPNTEYVLEMTFERRAKDWEGNIFTAEPGQYKSVCTVIYKDADNKPSGVETVPFSIQLV